MKVAIIGSRNIVVEDIGAYVPSETSEIVSGGARGIDECARRYASEKGIVYVEFLPDYKRFGRGAPIVRNKQIVDYSDKVIAIWDGISKGTEWVINYCERTNKQCKVYILLDK